MRRVNAEQIKRVLDALRNGPKSWSELLRLGIPERSLSRILKNYLEYWGLAEKDENTGKWMFILHFKRFRNYSEYRALWDHSMSLLPGLLALEWEIERGSEYGREDYIRSMCNVIVDSKSLDGLKALFMEHLRHPAYYDIMEKLSKLKEMSKNFDEKKFSLRKQMLEMLVKDPISIPIHGGERSMIEFYGISHDHFSNSSTGKSYRYVTDILKAIPEWMNRGFKPKFETINVNEREGMIGELWASGVLLARNVSREDAEKIKRTIKNILTDEGLKDKLEEVERIEDAIRKLKGDIIARLVEIRVSLRAGKPLEGACEVCRSLVIEEGKVTPSLKK